MTWRTVRLGEVADLLVGFAFKSTGFLDAHSDGIRLVRGDNVQQGVIRWGDKAKRWPREDLETLTRYELRLGDIILAMDRPIVGGGLKLASITEDDLPSFLVQRVCRVRGKADLANTLYLRYVLAHPDFSGHIDRITTGSNIPHVSARDIAAYFFSLPPLDEQVRLATVISAYDDLINNSQRRIKLLEEAARRLYREWFVALRFPGHERGTVVDGVPQGWERGSLADFAVVNQSSISVKHPPESLRYVDIASVGTGVINEAAEYLFAEAPGRARRRVHHGDTIWSCVRPNRRSYALIWEPADNLIVSTGFAVLSPVSMPLTYFHLAVTTDEFVGHLTANATGAAYPAVTARDFETATIVKPAAHVLAEFERLVVPWFAQQEVLKKQIKVLQQARDALLPRLMSGALAV